jgi:hypothetical protein
MNYRKSKKGQKKRTDIFHNKNLLEAHSIHNTSTMRQTGQSSPSNTSAANTGRNSFHVYFINGFDYWEITSAKEARFMLLGNKALVK